MLKKKLGIECIERDWNERIDDIYDYFKIPSTLVIPERCVRIGYSAFEEILGDNCKKLREIVIPRSVEEIGKQAFWDCSNATIILKKPKSKFKSIGDQAFHYVRDVKEEIRN